MVATFSDSSIKIQCTPAALSYIADKLANFLEAKALRIELKPTGCSGWSYHFNYGTQMNEDEVNVDINDDVSIWINKKHLDFFNGVIIDYQTSDFSGVLTCVNPKEGARCGCGESFMLEEV